MSVESIEIHTREHGAFFNEVRSFEYWPQSVNGDRPHGVSPDTPVPDVDEQKREVLVVAILTDCVGEVAALEEASGMIGFAPSQHAHHGLLACNIRLPEFVETKDWEVSC